jgi:hypothetical protein
VTAETKMNRLHPSLPRRPARTSEREERDDPKIRVFHEVLGERPLQISSSTDRVHVRLLDRRDGRFRSRFMFTRADLEQLDRALDAAREPQIRCIRTLSLKTGELLDVGAGQGAIFMRIRATEGSARVHVRIEGPALTALKFAIADLRSRTTTAA